MGYHSLDDVRHQINAGDREGARLALIDLLKTDPDDVDAWALLAILVTDPSEQAKCYLQILRIDPGNRQAAAWLEVLARQTPESVLKETPGEPSPGRQPPEEIDEIDRILEDLDLPDPDEKAPSQLGEPGLAIGPSQEGVTPSVAGFEERDLLDRILGRWGMGALDVEMPVLEAEPGEVPSRPGHLSPGDIIRLAGGPLAPEERRECPNCQAVISRQETKCPWCSAPLPAVDER